MKYLVLLDPSEDHGFGRHWHVEEAHSPEQAVAQAAGAAFPVPIEDQTPGGSYGSTALVHELGELMVLHSRQSWEVIAREHP